MKEYIEREDVLKRRRTITVTYHCQGADESDEYDVVLSEEIESIPAADVRPVVKAQWNGAPAILYPGYVCTCCGRFVSQKENYCPSCGADMEQDTNSERSSNNVWWQRSEYKAESHFELCEKENAQQNTKEVDAIKEPKELLDEANHNYEFAVEDAERLTQMIEKNAQPRWIPVTERLPEHGWYLAYGPTIKIKILHFHSAEEGWSSERYYNIGVTHWMPLPQPPKEW